MLLKEIIQELIFLLVMQLLLQALVIVYDPNWYPNMGGSHHMTQIPWIWWKDIDYAAIEKVIFYNDLGLSI